MQDETKKKAEASKNKIASLGPDIEIAKFIEPEERKRINSLSE